jgi:hypothetical protein
MRAALTALNRKQTDERRRKLDELIVEDESDRQQLATTANSEQESV